MIVLKSNGQLDVERVLPRQDADGNVILSPPDADIENRTLNTAAHARMESSNGRSSVGSWHEAQTSVEWSFVIDRPGSFEITAEAGTVAPETRFRIRCGTSTISAKVIRPAHMRNRRHSARYAGHRQGRRTPHRDRARCQH